MDRLRGLRAPLMLLGLACAPAHAQEVTQRGFVEVRAVLYPQSAPGGTERAVVEGLFRYEPAVRLANWLRVAGGLDARLDTDARVERRWTVDWWDRGSQRPALGVRRLSASAVRGPFSVEVGKQFVRWGKADILNPTDRFAPRDFLTVVDNDFLAVTGARGIYERKSETVDFVWVPRFTPSRIPLLHGRWTAFPPELQAFAIADAGARFPRRAQFGARWNHLGPGYEFSVSAYDGIDHLPLIQASASRDRAEIDVLRTYARMRMIGGDLAVPLRWFTVKGEAAYFASPTLEADEYGIYVLQLERQVGEWQIVGGYAGDFVRRAGSLARFAADRGLARSLLGRVACTIDTNRSAAFEAAVRQDGRGSWMKGEYSQAVGAHWRATASGNWIRGDADDFLGQYSRNSSLNLTLRYSF